MLTTLTNLLKVKKEKSTLLVLGLDNSGKSTIINCFKKPLDKATIKVPTVGFTIEDFYVKGSNVKCIDMSGASRFRNLWELHFKNCHGIIFVVDASDSMRFVVVSDELRKVLHHPDLRCRKIPILFYANKVNCEDAASNIKIAGVLRLNNIKEKPWHICSSDATSGEGLEEGMQWLIQQIKNV